MTNPDALAALGSDPADAQAAIEQGMSILLAGDVELELLTFPDDPTFVSGEEHDFVLVPTLSAYKLGGLRIESRAFLLGIRPRGGGKWTYVDGEQFEDENVQQLFPDFPLDQPLPDTHKAPAVTSGRVRRGTRLLLAHGTAPARHFSALAGLR